MRMRMRVHMMTEPTMAMTGKRGLACAMSGLAADTAALPTDMGAVPHTLSVLAGFDAEGSGLQYGRGTPFLSAAADMAS